MPGLTLSLETAKNTLLNMQVQLQTASHNISNAESKGYARQKVILAANPANWSSGGWLGTGAGVVTVMQMRDQYIEQQLMRSISDESQYGGLASQLDTIQAVFSDDGSTGISEALGDFWDTWDRLAQSPDGVSEQSALYESAKNLAQNIRTAYDHLNTIATDDIPSQIEDTANQANELIQTIADLNKAILKNESPGYPANDLRDARYQALKDLSELVPVKFSENDNNTLTVTTTDADGEVTLISGSEVKNLLDADSTISGGRLGGLRTAQEKANSYIDRLNTFATNLMAQVNAIHEQDDGTAVFTGNNASDIIAKDDFLSGQGTADEATRALKIAELQDSKITFPDLTLSLTFSDYLADVQRQIGTDTSSAHTSESYSQAQRMRLDSLQQNVSGVSIDEEMVDILQFQHIYQAAAKVVTTVSSMLDVIMGLVR